MKTYILGGLATIARYDAKIEGLEETVQDLRNALRA